MDDPRRALPQIDAVLAGMQPLGLDPVLARWIARQAVDVARRQLGSGVAAEDPVSLAQGLADQMTSPPARVINATGVVLHTNLGRAPLAAQAAEAGSAVSGPVALEMDLVTGQRGGRGRQAEMLAAGLCDAEAAIVVNNNAAGLVLILAALAGRREVLVSRGELIEIGGSFRLPEILAASGAILREVGTTNRTNLEDFAREASPRSAVILRAHPSNFRIEGFTEQPSLRDLAQLARERGICLVADIGSGLLEPADAVPDEPDARSAIKDGAELVCFSGDKLLGGPQAGLIVGSSSGVEALRRHPLFRAFRPGKVALAQLTATLQMHATGQRERLPVWSAISRQVADLHDLASWIIQRAGTGRIEGCVSLVGGGSAPGIQIDSVGIVLQGAPEALIAALRMHDPPVIARIESGSVLCDLRTVSETDAEDLASAIAAVTDRSGAGP